MLLVRFHRPLLLLLMCAIASPLAAANKKTPPARPINLNTATSGELQQVPGIGPVTAEKILKMRKVHGAFKSVDELRAIKGIGPKRLAKMKHYLTVDSVPSEKKSSKRAPPAPSPGPN